MFKLNALKKNSLYKFYEQVKHEVYKVFWLSKKELIILTSIVLVTVSVFSIICLFLDYSIHTLIQILLNIGKRE